MVGGRTATELLGREADEADSGGVKAREESQDDLGEGVGDVSDAEAEAEHAQRAGKGP